MKILKECYLSGLKFYALLLLGLVVFIVGLLVFLIPYNSGYGVEALSALGSILSAFATFYAAFVAIFMFNSWKYPQKHLNARKYSDDIRLAMSEYLKSLARYYDALHFSRQKIDNETLKEFCEADVQLSIRFEDLNRLLNESHIHLNEELNSFSELKLLLKESDTAVKSIMPFEIENTAIGFMDSKFQTELQNISTFNQKIKKYFEQEVIKDLNKKLKI